MAGFPLLPFDRALGEGEWPRRWTCGWGSALGPGRVAGGVAEPAALEKTWLPQAALFRSHA
jgi:hypothetical protein